MKKEKSKQPDLNNPDYIRITHEGRCPVEHRAIIFRIKNWQIIKYARVQANVNQQKNDQEQTTQGHYYFSTYSGREELRPFHKLSGGVEKFRAKVSRDR